MSFVTHPLIRPHTLQTRTYQETVVAQAIQTNLLCVLPTGLGKTPISIMLTAHRLERYPDSKVLMLAPTKPLANQNCESFKRFLTMPEDQFQVITGMVKATERERLYTEKQLLFATPQTIHNDLTEGRLSLKDFCLLIIDEAHHSIGKYAYVAVADRYRKEARFPKILGLTASPGATRTKINEICRSLGIEAVEIRSEQDEDVAPYVQEKQIEWISVEMPERFLTVMRLIKDAYQDRVDGLKKRGFLRPKKIVTKKELLALQAALQKRIGSGTPVTYWASSQLAQAIKLEHALTLLETQGVTILEAYWKKLRQEQTKAAERLRNDKAVSDAMFLTHQLLEEGATHPKMGKLCTLVSQELRERPEAKIIIFATYRDTVKEIVAALQRIEGVQPVMLIGQKEGLSQKEQIETIRRFEQGEHNALVGTSISEEGLDIKGATTAIFYDTAPSEIRTIQRRGRVGRLEVGTILILLTKKTRDEAYYWAAHHKEKRMREILKDMREQGYGEPDFLA